MFALWHTRCSSGLKPSGFVAGKTRRNPPMNEKTRRILEMGKRALEFSKAHPDPSPEYAATVARLEALLARAEELKKQEREERKGTVLPFEKRRTDHPTDPAA